MANDKHKGSYRTKDGKSQIEWELKAKEKGYTFTAMGTCPDSSGQCLDQIQKDHPDDEVVQRIVRVWERWHLNDMRAECEHQRESELNILSETCPTCGYKHGTAWRHEVIPDDVIKEIESWSGFEQPKDTLEEHLATSFLQRHEITLEARKGDAKANWKPAGQHYVVTLSKTSGESYSFDFWDSIHNTEKGIPLEESSVLSCIASDVTLEVDSFEDYCWMMGLDTDSRATPVQWEEVKKQVDKMRKFFTEKEIEELGELQ